MNVFGGRDVPSRVSFFIDAEQGSFQRVRDHFAFDESATHESDRPIAHECAARFPGLAIKRLNTLSETGEKESSSVTGRGEIGYHRATGE